MGTGAMRIGDGEHLCCVLFRFMHPSFFSRASTSSDQKVIVRVSVVSAAKRGTGTTRAGWAQEERQTERGEGWLGKRKWLVLLFFFLFDMFCLFLILLLLNYRKWGRRRLQPA